MRDPPNLINLTFGLLIALTAVQLMLTVPGGHVVPYVVIATVCVPFALSKSLAVRVWSVAATLCVLGLIAWDHDAGTRFERKMYRMLSRPIDSKNEPRTGHAHDHD